MFRLVKGRTLFIGSEFGIFGGFGWVCSSVLVDEPGFGRVRSSVFTELNLCLACFGLNRFHIQAFWRGSKFSFEFDGFTNIKMFLFEIILILVLNDVFTTIFIFSISQHWKAKVIKLWNLNSLWQPPVVFLPYLP